MSIHEFLINQYDTIHLRKKVKICNCQTRNTLNKRTELFIDIKQSDLF